jgi:hypothetical protein
MTPYLIGVGLALAISQGARLVGFDRDRSFYPVVACVVASYYGLFAVMGGSPQDALPEFLVIAGFLALAVCGFKISLWFVVVALAGHGLMDFFHSRLITNPGVPGWWPAFCGSYDVTAALYLAVLLRSSRTLPASACDEGNLDKVP